MRRGDVVIVSLPSDYGKPRPAVVLQNDRFEGRLESYIIALLTTFDEGAKLLRVGVEPTAENGLRKASKVMVDRLHALPGHRIHPHVGRRHAEAMRQVDRELTMMPDLDR